MGVIGKKWEGKGVLFTGCYLPEAVAFAGASVSLVFDMISWRFLHRVVMSSLSEGMEWKDRLDTSLAWDRYMKSTT